MKLDYMVPAEAGFPAWSNAEQTAVDINVFFPHLGETVRYTAAQEDPGWEHSEEIYRRATSGDYGDITRYVPREDRLPKLTARQLRIGLIREDIFQDTILSILNAIPDAVTREEARVEWEYATEYDFNHPLTPFVAKALGKDLQGVRPLWRSWAEI